MGIKYLWDTNTAIYYIQKQFPPEAEMLIDKLQCEAQPCISVISEIELLCWKTATEKDLQVLNDFIDAALVIELEQSVKLKTADIRKKYKIHLPDAIIAATAIAFDFVLVTRNEKDFRNIEGLKLINPWQNIAGY